MNWKRPWNSNLIKNLKINIRTSMTKWLTLWILWTSADAGNKIWWIHHSSHKSNILTWVIKTSEKSTMAKLREAMEHYKWIIPHQCRRCPKWINWLQWPIPMVKHLINSISKAKNSETISKKEQTNSKIILSPTLTEVSNFSRSRMLTNKRKWRKLKTMLIF